MAKLTRAQIREGLDQTPIEAVILGSVNNSGIKLTHKEKRFAEEIALGATKSDAYRKAYKPRGKNATIHKRAHEVSKRGEVLGYAESLKAAMEAERLATPAHLRALTIHELTKGALDPEMPPAQRVKCLELLGKITEVSLFTERREIVRVNKSEDARAALLASIKAAIKIDAIDAKVLEGDDLLAELARAKTPTADDNAEAATPPGAHPPSSSEDSAQPLLSNPHTRSDSLTNQSPGTQTIVDSDGEEFEPKISL